MSIYHKIKKAVITEKSQGLASQGKYVFTVSGDASKKEIAEAIEASFKDVKVGAVNVCKVPGKRIRWLRRGRRYLFGQRSGIKKAIVTLKKGKIGLFEKAR